MLRAGLIGVGSISKVHRDGYVRCKKEGGPVELVACCDIRPECLEAEDFAGCRKYTSVDEMLKVEVGKLDIIDICVPTFLHSEIAVKAMEAGFNVISEKPMARTVEQAQAMIDASERTGKKLMIAYCNRFNALMDEVVATIKSGELGELCCAEFWRGGGSRGPMGWENWFRDGDLSGGAVLDLHIHDVDMIQYLFGTPKAVVALAASNQTKNGYDRVSAQYIYGNGKYAHAYCDWSTAHMKANTRSYRITFENGYIYCDRTPDRKMCIKMDVNGNRTDLTEKMDDVGNMYYNEIKYFAECVEKNTNPEISMPRDTINSIRMVMAEIESADKDGEKISL